MELLRALIEELENFDRIVQDIQEEVIRNNEAVVLDMVTEAQLYERGINGRGVRLDSFAPYSPVTIQIKQAKGQPTDRVTLRDEGDFHRSFFIEFDSEGFEIKASDWKAPKLTRLYGPEIYDLFEENVVDLAENYMVPEIVNHFKG